MQSVVIMMVPFPVLMRPLTSAEGPGSKERVSGLGLTRVRRWAGLGLRIGQKRSLASGVTWPTMMPCEAPLRTGKTLDNCCCDPPQTLDSRP